MPLSLVPNWYWLRSERAAIRLRPDEHTRLVKANPHAMLRLPMNSSI